MDTTKLAPKPCARDGCEEPRRRYPSGRTATLCTTHEYERVARVKARRVIDPVTGRETTANSLAWYRHQRKAQAAMVEDGAA